MEILQILIALVYFGVGVAIASVIQETNDGEISGFVFGMCIFFWPIVLVGLLLLGFLLLFAEIGQRIGRFIKKIVEKRGE